MADSKGRRITGAARARLLADIKRRYEGGSSVRAIAQQLGHSYSFVRRALAEAGVVLRSSVPANSAPAPSARDDAHRLLDLVPPDELPAVVEHLRQVTASSSTPTSGRRQFRTVGIFDGEPDLGARTRDVLRHELGSKDERSA